MAVKNFLDKSGLDKLWEKICTVFAPKWLAYKPESSIGQSDKALIITHKSAGKTDNKGNDIIVTLPLATNSYAGLLSPTEKVAINSINTSISNSSKYSSSITPTTITMPNAVGGIAEGTKVSDLNGKTFSELFDDLLFPATNPTYTSPSVSGFILSNATTPVEIGTNIATISAATLNRGEWSPYNVQDNDTNLPAAGTVSSTKYSITINGTTSTSLPTSGKYTTLGNQNYSVTISYNAGPIPKNNKGIEVPALRLNAGEVSATRTINVSCPIFATTVSIGTFTKLNTLKTWSNSAIISPEFTLVAQGDISGTVSERNTQAISIPYPSGRNTTVKIEFYNTVSGKWEDNTNQFALKDNNPTNINGVSINYRYYYFNSKNSIGDRKFRITF